VDHAGSQFDSTTTGLQGTAEGREDSKLLRTWYARPARSVMTEPISVQLDCSCKRRASPLTS